MKKFIFVLIIYCISLLAQESTSVELYFGTEQASGGDITFTLSNQGQVWGGNVLSAGCSLSYYKTNLFNNAKYTVNSHNTIISSWKGLDFTTSQDNIGVYEAYGYGLYKITNSESDEYFYIDYRDQRITCTPYGNIGHPIDLWIKYNATTNTFSYGNQGGSLPFYSISNGQLYSLWQLKNAGLQQTSNLPEFWINCLVLIPTVTNHPRLVWGPHPTFGATNYKLYRAISDHPANPLSLTYSLIATTNSTTFEYTDVDALLNGDSYYAYYYVKAYRTSPSPNYSDASNYVNTVADFEFNKEKTASIKHLEYKFSLGENFPNPFNPNTVINYSIQEAGKVKIKVFDILGSEVAELVNETKEAGNFAVEFNAANLPSGVYIYSLQANSYSNSKKMLLMK